MDITTAPAPAAVTLGVHPPSPADVVAVARHGASVTLDDDAHEALAVGRRHVEELAHRATPVYGVSTGFGALADRHIPAGAAHEAAAVADPLARRRVRPTGRA
jgi:histidine ammonia-lyase